MKETILVLGGCRSGKSSHALELAENIAGNRVFVATCVPYDDEMQARVDNHQKERSDHWITVETPVEIAKAILDHSDTADVILVDCLTLWMSNLLGQDKTDDAVFEAVRELKAALEAARCTVILVSNEVGAGIVPDNALARRFRDLTGFANQRIAAAVDRVILTVAGIPMTVKPQK